MTLLFVRGKWQSFDNWDKDDISRVTFMGFSCFSIEKSSHEWKEIDERLAECVFSSVGIKTRSCWGTFCLGSIFVGDVKQALHFGKYAYRYACEIRDVLASLKFISLSFSSILALWYERSDDWRGTLVFQSMSILSSFLFTLSTSAKFEQRLTSHHSL